MFFCVLVLSFTYHRGFPQFYPHIKFTDPCYFRLSSKSNDLFQYTTQPDRMTAPWAAHATMSALFSDMVKAGKVMIHNTMFVIGTNSGDEHNNLLKAVLNRFVEHGVTVNQEYVKKVCLPNAKVCGVIVYNEGAEANLVKRGRKLLLWPRPKTQADTLRFLRFMGDYARCIENFENLHKPLHTMVIAPTFYWNKKLSYCFGELKAKLINFTVRDIDYRQDMHVYCEHNRLESSFQAVLFQNETWDQPGTMKRVVPLAFGSRKLTEEELKMSA